MKNNKDEWRLIIEIKHKEKTKDEKIAHLTGVVDILSDKLKRREEQLPSKELYTRIDELETDNRLVKNLANMYKGNFLDLQAAHNTVVSDKKKDYKNSMFIIIILVFAILICLIKINLT